MSFPKAQKNSELTHKTTRSSDKSLILASLLPILIILLPSFLSAAPSLVPSFKFKDAIQFGFMVSNILLFSANESKAKFKVKGHFELY